MNPSPEAAGSERPERSFAAAAAVVAAIPLALHGAALDGYGIFRDELYFIACGRHPAFGYVDQPPLVPLLAAATQLGGEHLGLLRLVAALADAGAVLAACAVVRALGGGAFAALLAGLASALAPQLLGMGSALGTTTLEPLLWTLLTYAAVCAVDRDRRWWLTAGAIGGIALENKYSIAFYLAALVAGLLAAGPRAALRSRAFWGGVVLCALIAAPSVAWQAANGWPMLELLQNGAAGKNVVLSPSAWLAAQVMGYGPLLAPLWFGGIVALVARRNVRFVGLAAIALFAAFIALHAKPYYLVGVYPTLFAAGAVGFERAVRARALRAVYAALVVASTVPFVPLAVPLLREPEFVSYRAALFAALHVPPPGDDEHHRAAVLPQFYADMHGWPELAAAVTRVESTLTPAERSRAAVYAQNYGEAAAVDVLGSGALPVISGHNAYFTWGPHGDHDVLVIVGGDIADHRKVFADVRRVATVGTPYAMPYENGLGIYVARRPTVDWLFLWPSLKTYE